MFDLIASVLAFFYDIWPSYGVSIVFLTLAVMVVATPLTLKSTKSMLQMQRLQPELKAIQNRYKDDRPKMNEELMAKRQAVEGPIAKFFDPNGIIDQYFLTHLNPILAAVGLIKIKVSYLLRLRMLSTRTGEPYGFSIGIGTILIKGSDMGEIPTSERAWQRIDWPSSGRVTSIRFKFFDFTYRMPHYYTWPGPITVERPDQEAFGRQSAPDLLHYRPPFVPRLTIF